jgi:hypothetical protein
VRWAVAKRSKVRAEEVDPLLFMAALSGYDQCLVGDWNANQMHEALTLFDSLVNREYFRNRFGPCDYHQPGPITPKYQRCP